MDDTKDQPLSDLDALLKKLNAESYSSDPADTITLSNTQGSCYGYMSVSSFPNAIWAGSSITSPTTITTSTSTGTSSLPWYTASPSTKISLAGENADVEVNGWSLVQAVKRIEQRLELFQLNPELEKEWQDLKRLGDRYRKLEQRIKDKQATFDRLKAMPAPEIR